MLGQYLAAAVAGTAAALVERAKAHPLIDTQRRLVVALAAGSASASGLPAALGPTTPAGSLSTIPAQSAAVCTWQVTAGTGVLPLVPAWATGAGKKIGEPVTANGNVYRCITAGTTAGSGSGPSGTDSDITDNTVHWAYVGPVATAFAGGFVMVNIDSTSIIYYGTDAAITTTVASAPLAKDGGSVAMNASPALFKVVAGASAIVGVTALV